MKMDKLDLQILAELDTSARSSMKNIADSVSASREVVNYRIKNLEKRGVIRGYHALFNFSKMGYLIFRADIRFKNMSSETENKMEEFLENSKSASAIMKTENVWDMTVMYMTRDFSEFREEWDRFERRFKSNIMEKNHAVVYEIVYHGRGYLGKSGWKKHIGISAREKIDSTDIELMKILSGNAREPLVKIAEKLSMTAANVSYRMKRLEDMGVILCYRADLDLRKLGMKYYKVGIELEKKDNEGSLREFISSHPNITYEDMTIGGSNIEFDLEVESEYRFKEIVDEIKKILGSDILYIRYCRSRDIPKMRYFPEMDRADENFKEHPEEPKVS